jgi:acyl carrier protein
MILLSRSGANSDKAEMILGQLRAQGVSVESPACDITKFASLESALESCSHFPPIKGCFQGAMILRDSTFAKMTFEQWTAATSPKIQGSWNLHQALEKEDLDFFILLSSAGAILGNAGQSNYSAGNTFQDALARFRNSRGQKALSLNLGMIMGQGYVAENDAVRERLLRKAEFFPIVLEELLAMLDYCCNPNLNPLSSDESQLVTGVVLPAQLLADGKDVSLLFSQPMFRCMAQTPVRESSKSHDDAGREDLLAAFHGTQDATEAANIATRILQLRTSRLLGMPEDEIKSSSQLEHYGVDSLVAIELRNWISKELGVDVAVFEILGGMTLLELGALLAQRKLYT